MGGMGIGAVEKKDVMRASAMLEKKREYAAIPVFPCVLKIMPTVIWRTKDPIVLDVHVVEGITVYFF